MKAAPKAIVNRVNEINTLYQGAEAADLFVTAYFGSTWPTIINTEAPVEIKGRFVYITTDGKRERFNTGDEWQLSDLKWNLNHIKRALTKELKHV